MGVNNQSGRKRGLISFLAFATFAMTLVAADMAQAACTWRLTGQLVRSDPLPTDDGAIEGPGYSLDVMTMARFTNGSLCPGGECPFNTTNWLQGSSDWDGNFVLLSAPHPGPTCHVDRDFVFMIQGEKANISSWQTIDNRNGIDGPAFPGPSPVFIHEINLGSIKVDDLPPPEGYEVPGASNGMDVGNATMEPVPSGGPNLPPGTFEPAPTPNAGPNLPPGTFEPAPVPGGEGDDENALPDVTIEPNTNPFPGTDDEGEEESGLPDVTIEPNTNPFPGTGNEEEEPDTDTGSENDDTASNFPDAQFEPNPCPDLSMTGIEMADFAFGPHPGEGTSNKSPDGLIRIQQRQSGGTPMARRLSVTFEVENHGAQHNRRSGQCSVDVQLRLNEGPDRDGAGADAWHSYEDPIPTINANWQRFITMSAVTRGTGNDTNSSWNENYEYVRIQVLLDYNNGVSEANEGDNVAGDYCYHATTNTFVDLGTCDAAAAAFD